MDREENEPNISSRIESPPVISNQGEKDPKKKSEREQPEE